ncbi:MAG: YggS family pyridoxal phosphate-dependent enzyme [Mangrovibacterium sp.]
MSIAENIRIIKNNLPESVCLVVVSKYNPVEMIQMAYDAGHRVFGESKVQEVVRKYEELPKDINWHFIGHLQTNKVKYIAPFVSLIHGIDSWKLLEQVNKDAKKNGRIIDCLLQFHIAQEETKFGLNREEAFEMLASTAFKQLQHVRICGVMGMASYCDDESQVNLEFANLSEIFQSLKKSFFALDESFKVVSMGMSGDYKLAIAQGSTMIRVGSAIFGERIY